MFDPIWMAALGTPQQQLECSVKKNECIANCEGGYSVAVGICFAMPSPFAIAVCQLVALSGFSYCQSTCVVDYPC